MAQVAHLSGRKIPAHLFSLCGQAKKQEPKQASEIQAALQIFFINFTQPQWHWIETRKRAKRTQGRVAPTPTLTFCGLSQEFLHTD